MFRWAVATYLLMIKWISDGGYQSVKIEKIHNDAIDMTYAAYGTYYDGVLTKDGKLQEIALQTRTFIEYMET